MGQYSGFTEAELIAAEWSRSQKKKEEKKEKRKSSRRKRKRERSTDSYGRFKRSSSTKDNLHSRHNRHKKKKSLSSLSSSDSSTSIPLNPFNPLQEAYDSRIYKKRYKSPSRSIHYYRKNHRKVYSRYFRSDYNREKKKKNRSRSSSHSGSWSHEGYFLKSPTPERKNITGPMWNTRKGQWKSLAGGVYIPASRSPSSSN